MDNIKLKVITCVVLGLLFFMGFNSCKVKEDSTEWLDLKIWNQSTQAFITNKCNSNGLLKEKLEPVLSYENKTFNSLGEYIDYRLIFRNEIQAKLTQLENSLELSNLRIEEFYNNESETARLIMTNQSTGSVDIAIIKSSRDTTTMKKIEGEDYIENDYSDDCILAIKDAIATRFSIVTDFSKGQESVTKFFSLY